MAYYKITLYINGRKKPLQGIREYLTDDLSYVYELALQQTLKYYLKTDIIKIDIWPMLESSKEVLEYLRKKEINGSVA